MTGNTHSHTQIHVVVIRDLGPRILAQGHHPLYHGGAYNADFGAAVEDLFYKYGVDAYFSGHVHSYERDVPVYKSVIDPAGYVNPAATAYFMIGGAGNYEMHKAEKGKNSPAVEKAREAAKKYDPSPKEDGKDGRWKKPTKCGLTYVNTSLPNANKLYLVINSNI